MSMIRNQLTATLLACALSIIATAPARALDADSVMRDMQRTADWQLENPSRHLPGDWTHAPFYLGLLNLHLVSGEARYLDALTGFGERTGFGPGTALAVTHADDHAVLQAWLELYRLTRDPAHLQPAIDHFHVVTTALRETPPRSASGGTFTWCWCDALFMSPPVWFQLSQITGDTRFAEFADREWWTTTDVLYNPAEALYYRDNRYFDTRTESGRKTFWARGNGWVVGGLVHSLDQLPADHPSRGKYLALYHDMMRALLDLQNPDGKWRTSLLDPQWEQGEASGTAFFAYAMAWGINRGLLDAALFRPAVERVWNALAAGIRPDGMLGYVQRIDERPDGGQTGADSTEIYGTGAFLLAGAEIIRMLDPAKRRGDVATFDGVTLPDRFLRAEPSTHARYVAERAGDFAWENDLIAFRTYGPPLRESTEDSGFDAWLKRVPWPILDKWYMEELTKAPYGNVNKSYHTDHGEGSDPYKVGNSRGCGSIAVWRDGKLHNPRNFIAHDILESSREQSAFQLHHATMLGDAELRATKHFTIRLGERLFQLDAKFTIDGEPAAGLDVAIGLNHQAAESTHTVDADSGAVRIWEPLEGLGLGTGIVIDPARIREVIEHTDASGNRQTLVIARTDAAGHIRWFTGFGWEGQGEITSDELWAAALREFAARTRDEAFVASPQFETHALPVSADPE
jgi:rhamnogalacturonyl hydrolase YesR